MINRPGRVFYHIEFTSISKEFIQEYCDDNLDDLDEVENIIKLKSAIPKFNFDMLQSLVEEMNRYKESAIKYLNISIQEDDKSEYDIMSITFEDAKTISIDTTCVEFSMSPDASFYVCFYSRKKGRRRGRTRKGLATI